MWNANKYVIKILKSINLGALDYRIMPETTLQAKMLPKSTSPSSQTKIRFPQANVLKYLPQAKSIALGSTKEFAWGASGPKFA